MNFYDAFGDAIFFSGLDGWVNTHGEIEKCTCWLEVGF
jgi:hypothetical protein